MNGGSQLYAGVDEVGRGPLFGPVLASAVILPTDVLLDGLDDSKRLSEAKRQSLFDEIEDVALAISIAQASVQEIDRLNIHHATLLAMQRAISGLDVVPYEVLIDGKFCPECPYPCRAVIGGDRLVAAISAASIIAKVTRDKLMKEMDEQFMVYDLASNKGYGTKNHIQAIRLHGYTYHHRRTFEPIKSMLKEID